MIHLVCNLMTTVNRAKTLTQILTTRTSNKDSNENERTTTTDRRASTRTKATIMCTKAYAIVWAFRYEIDYGKFKYRVLDMVSVPSHFPG